MYQCDSKWTNLSVALGGYVYAIGGYRESTGPTERYDPATNAWTSLQNLGSLFRWGAVAVLNGQIWACGGDNRNGQCHKLDTSSGFWFAAATMNEPRSVILNSKSRQLHNSQSCSVFRQYFCMAAIYDKLYAVSGDNTTSIEFFDANNPAAGWQMYSQAAFVVARPGISCVAIRTGTHFLLASASAH